MLCFKSTHQGTSEVTSPLFSRRFGQVSVVLSSNSTDGVWGRYCNGLQLVVACRFQRNAGNSYSNSFPLLTQDLGGDRCLLYFL